MKRVFTDAEHQACARSLGLAEMPRAFSQVILELRHQPSREPVVIMEFAEMDPEQFREWKRESGKWIIP
ncbi:MAG: hypothetical protein WBP69_19990 [Terriglobales bacterium]